MAGRTKLDHGDRRPGRKPVARYVGQDRRGNPGVLRVAIVDLGQAIGALTSARSELEAALLEADRRARDAAVADAFDRVRIGVRFAEQARRGRKPKRRAAKTQLALRLKP